VQFGLDRITDLPGIDELVGSGIADAALARALGMPIPSDSAGLSADEDPLEPDLFDVMAEERLDALAAEPPLDPDGADMPAEAETRSASKPPPDVQT
jgi:segregation and condensation protein B